MTKFYGIIAYGIMTEVSPGVWEESIVEKTYYGESTKIGSRNQTVADQVIDHIVVNNQISVIADGFAYENFVNIKYVEWLGARWKVSSVEVLRPRLVLSLGGTYNG